MNSGKKYLGTKMNSNKGENVENTEETPATATKLMSRSSRYTHYTIQYTYTKKISTFSQSPIYKVKPVLTK